MDKGFICDKYPGKATITPEFCSRRHHKAIEHPNDGDLDACRMCEAGIKALKLFGYTKPIRAAMPSNKWKPRFKCPDCGEPVTRREQCVRCKLEKPKEEIIMAKSDKKTCNSAEGCVKPIKSKGLCNKHYLVQLKADGRIGARKGKKIRVSKTKPLSAIKPSEVKKTAAASEPGIKSNGKHLIGQLLYASELLDKQINLALETGAIDTAIILDIRLRVGTVLKETVLKESMEVS